MPKQTTLLIILDGWGMPAKNCKASAITPQTAPNFYKWLKDYPSSELEASGEAVGLRKGQEGNSEAGHLNIGAGRVVKQDAIYVSDAIKDDSFFKNNAFQQAIHHVKKYQTSVHVMGLLSNHNSAHSCPEHVYALLDLFHKEGVKKVFLHLFTDGRDSGQHDALSHLNKLEAHFHGNEKIATVMGRFYAMDRNKVWERTEAAYNAIVCGKGKMASGAEEAISMAYNSEESDEFISPTVITENNKPVATVKDNDVFFFFNLRSDRARQLTKSLVQKDFEKSNPGAFHRAHVPKNNRFVAMTDFGPDLAGIFTAFPSRDVKNSLVAVLCPKHQLYIAESEKFAHVTYFLNGGYAQHFCDEQWVKIESDHLKNFVNKPEMKSRELGSHVIKAIEKNEYEFIAVNFANADMIGHTGNLEAGKKAVRALDEVLGKIVSATIKAGAICVITADHGNAEEMINSKTGETDSEHSINPVPFIIVSDTKDFKRLKLKKNLRAGRLCDVAPTILKLMDIKAPREMTGKPLF
ncbi:MAG: 2,3-bisphosphoglycerate-independent phosphoglycerate mutase [Patescibacteria group bacterium]|jgi:2,3-bisphosphoglycerate-independent phosphoglycerate mutase